MPKHAPGIAIDPAMQTSNLIRMPPFFLYSLNTQSLSLTRENTGLTLSKAELSLQVFWKKHDETGHYH